MMRQSVLEPMKRCAVLFFLVTAGCVMAPRPRYLPARTFISGTHQEGHDATEPRPAQSRYFKTEIAGFAIADGVAGYQVFIDVITPPSQRIYTRAILENPENPEAPIVYEHYIDPETPSTAMRHLPVKGLKIYKNYRIELVAYADEARTQEIDRLTQKIRSYLDTTGNEILLYRGLIIDPKQ